MIAFYFKGEMFGKRGYYIALRHADYAFYFGALATAKQLSAKNMVSRKCLLLSGVESKIKNLT